MVAISRSKVKIWIEDAGTNPSALVDSDAVAGEIKSYAKSGGTKEVESDPVFGGFVDKEKPTEQVEISMEVVPKVDTDQDRWDAMAYAADGTGVYTMASSVSTQPNDKAIFIGASDGTNGKAWAFNNCNVTVFDIEHNADDNQTGNITFKFSPENDSGVSNFQTLGGASTTPAIAVTSLLQSWSALDNN